MQAPPPAVASAEVFRRERIYSTTDHPDGGDQNKTIVVSLKFTAYFRKPKSTLGSGLRIVKWLIVNG
jgi:hypothetical protein